MPQVPEGIDRCRSEHIEQGYVADCADTEVRLRRIGEARVMTVKQGSGAERREEEVEITEGQYRALWPLSEGRRVAKRRFYLPIDGLVAEVDVYAGDLEGLLTAEVEFSSRKESGSFDPPSWFGTEVTGDSRFANRALAHHGLPEEVSE